MSAPELQHEQVARGLPALAARARQLDLQLAGSLIAVPPDQRAALAHELRAHGCTVHLDVIEGSYRGQAGIDLADVAQLVAPDVDVHLMVDDPLAAVEQLRASLPRAQRLGRLTVQLTAQVESSPVESSQVAAVLERARGAAHQVWLGVHGPDPHLEALDAVHRSGADGVLVMLTPPGRPGHRADLGDLRVVERARQLGLAAGVDGGVEAPDLAAVAAAGAGHVVVGRALHRADESGAGA